MPKSNAWPLAYASGPETLGQYMQRQAALETDGGREAFGAMDLSELEVRIAAIYFHDNNPTTED